MSDIYIQRDHKLQPEELRELIENLARDIQGRLGGKYHWEGDHCVRYQYTGVDANLTFDESVVTVKVTLGLLMLALKGMLEREIHEHLDDHLGC